MSKGSPIHPVRIPADLVVEVYRTIARRNAWSRRPPWTLSSFVKDAIAEKIRKMDRSRRQGGRKKKKQRLSMDSVSQHTANPSPSP